MLRLLSAELRYNMGGILLWFCVLVFASVWPLFEGSGIATSLVIFSIFLPFAALSGTFTVLAGARNEKRLRLFRSLPVSDTAVILARFASAQAIPLLAAVLIAIALITGVILDGAEFLARLEGGWALPSLFFLAAAVSALTLLITNLVNLTAAQLAIVFLGAALVMGFFSEAVMDSVLTPAGALLQTPAGAAASVALFLLIAATDVFTSSRRMPEQ